MAELTVRRDGMQVGDIVSTDQGPLVAQRHGAGSTERRTLIGVVKESVSQGKWKVLFTGETESRVMDEQHLRLEESRGTIVEDRGVGNAAAAVVSPAAHIAAAALLEASTGAGTATNTAGQENAYDLRRETRDTGDASGESAERGAADTACALIIGDSDFGSIKSAVQHGKAGKHFIGALKMRRAQDAARLAGPTARRARRPEVLARFFKYSNTIIDTHNQGRQSDLGLEALWAGTSSS